MIKYSEIIDYVTHEFQCETCGKLLKVRIRKFKFPVEAAHQGIYRYKGKSTCSECKTKNDFVAKVFYKIQNAGRRKSSKLVKDKQKYIRSWKHRADAHCRMCTNYDHIDCEVTSCPFYGIQSWHKCKPSDNDYWWANKVSHLKQAHDRFYMGPRWVKMTNEESNESSTTQTTEESSKKSE